jgi:hypothetical protein
MIRGINELVAGHAQRFGVERLADIQKGVNCLRRANGRVRTGVKGSASIDPPERAGIAARPCQNRA